MTDDLLAAVREAIAATTVPDYILTMEAEAAVRAMLALGFIQAHGWEYAVRRGDVTLEQGYNTQEQARAWIDSYGVTGETIIRRPVGVWEEVTDSLPQ